VKREENSDRRCSHYGQLSPLPGSDITWQNPLILLTDILGSHHGHRLKYATVALCCPRRCNQTGKILPSGAQR
jgi:hypothetical protein